MTDLSRRQLFRAAGGLAVAGLAAGCTTSVAGSPVAVPHPTPVTPPGPLDNLSKARQAGGVAALTIADSEPFSYQDQSGVTGEAVEVIRAVFAAIGIPRVRFELVDFAGAQQKVMAMAAAGDDTFAVLAPGTLFRSTACQAFDLVPDYAYQIAFGVPKGNPKGIKGVADVVQGKRTVAAITGAALQGELQEAGVPSASIKTFPEPVAAMQAVASGQADCFPFYDISLRHLVADGGPVPGLEATEPAKIPGGAPMVSGFQFIKQDDTSIRDAFAAQLQTMRQNGQWLQIASRFGLTQGNAVPSTFSIDQVCH